MSTLIVGLIVAGVVFLAARQIYKEKESRSAAENVPAVLTDALAEAVVTGRRKSERTYIFPEKISLRNI